MIVTCIDNLRSALADTPTSSGTAIPSRDILRHHLEGLEGSTIRLRPGDPHPYRVLALVFRLPDLRPEPRAILLNYLHSNLDLSQADTESYSSAAIKVPPVLEPQPGTDSPPPPQQEAPAPEAPAPASSSSPDAGSFATPARREDFFDRFLSRVASLVS